MKLIVAVDERWGIGAENKLLFSISEDMKFFRETTLNQLVIMGHETLRSLPQGAPLKRRTNIVLSRQVGLEVPGALVCASLPELFEALVEHGELEAYVIGGAAVYAALLDYCEEALVTKVFAEQGADRFFPNLDEQEAWCLQGRSDIKTQADLQYQFCSYINKAPRPF